MAGSMAGLMAGSMAGLMAGMAGSMAGSMAGLMAGLGTPLFTAAAKLFTFPSLVDFSASPMTASYTRDRGGLSFAAFRVRVSGLELTPQ